MLLKRVEINEKHRCWNTNPICVRWFLRTVEGHANETIGRRGYIYLNQICETLDVEWNPNDDNPCIKKDGMDQIACIRFEILVREDGTFLVDIYCYD